MDANNLFQIYAPLWEAVPETRPRRQSCGDNAPLTFLSGWGWGHCYGEDAEVDEDAAAALCRVAAEDWLVARVQLDGAVVTHKMGGVYGVFVWDRHKTGQCQDEGFPCIHHALALACLAVAGAKA